MNELVIIITNKTTTKEFCDVDETLNMLELSLYNNGNNICGLRRYDKGLCLKDVSSNPERNFDILILPDTDFQEDFAEMIKYFTTGLKTVFILYHKNPNNSKLPESQARFMEKVIVNTTINKLSQSHVSNSIYCTELKEIANSIKNKNQAEYYSVLERMKKKFPDDTKEKKLILLHDCLHPQSAETTDISWLSNEQKNLVMKLVAIKDNLNPNYIRILTELRISLLGS